VTINVLEKTCVISTVLTDSGVDGSAEEQSSPVCPLGRLGDGSQVLLVLHVAVQQCFDGGRQVVVPVFVDVGPSCRSHVRRQEGGGRGVDDARHAAVPAINKTMALCRLRPRHSLHEELPGVIHRRNATNTMQQDP